MVSTQKKQLSNKSIAVAGVGRMGRGIALAFIYQGYTVHLIDIKKRSMEAFNQLVSTTIFELKQQINMLDVRGVMSDSEIEILMSNIKISHMDDELVDWIKADVLFEAVPEKLKVKEETFSRICKKLSNDALIASTTSSFLSNELALYVKHPERFMNTHWLNPAHLIPLIEVSPGNDTSKENINKMFHLLEKIGKVPVECAASPGFIVPRIQALAMNEAARLVEEEVASEESIDKAIRSGFGPRFTILGLLEFIDWGGADTLYHASNYMADALQDERFSPPKIVNEKMNNGEIGMKTKKGFYEFDEHNMGEYQKETLKKMIDLFQHLGYIPTVQPDKLS